MALASLAFVALPRVALADLVRGDDVPLGYFAYEIAAADFDGDGSKDLALTRHHSVVIFSGHGDGTFEQAGRYSVGVEPSRLVVADLNRDGDKDLVTANFESDDVSVLIGRGDGSFKRRVNYGAGDGPTYVAVGDLNGDHRPDLAVTNVWDEDVSIRLGRGDGTFQPKRDYAAGSGPGSGPKSVAVADLNHDHKRDLAVADFARVVVLKGKGDGTFGHKRDIGMRPGLPGLREILASDFNRDGATDLAVTDRGDWAVYVAAGRGDGTFEAPAVYGVDSAPTKVAAADLSGDGREDLIVETEGYPGGFGDNPGFLYVLQGQQDGSFTDDITQILDGDGGRFAVGDLNGDGTRDVAAMTYAPSPKIEIFLNQ